MEAVVNVFVLLTMKLVLMSKNTISQEIASGDVEWEKFGICDYITKPRVAAAITGKTPEGNKVVGDYKFIDEFPMSEGFEENAEFLL